MSLKVVFDHAKENYVPGEFIKGRVQCSLRVPLPEYVEVDIQIIGERSCPDDATKTTITSPSSVKSNFLDSVETVLYLGYLNEGEYDFPFKLSLPLGIPGTFVKKNGYVKYYLKTCMYGCCFGQKISEDRKEFKIVSSIDPDEFFSEMDQDDYYSAIDPNEIDEMKYLLIDTEKMSFKVLIDHPKKNCKAGEFINGRVQCSIRVPDDIEVRLKLIGEERCAITKTMLTSSNSQKRYFLETENTVIHSGYLNKGEYEFRFTLTLPWGIPSTFEGKYGYIKYYLKACMYGREQKRYETKKEFEVFSPIDLNEMENVSMVPSRYFSESTEENMFLCTPQSPDMQVRLEKNAFVVGETVNAVVQIRKRAKISKVEARLIINIKARAIPQRDKPLNNMILVVSDKVDIHEKKSQMFLLKIPSDFEIPNFEKSRFFCPTAVLQVTAEFEDPFKPVLRIDVELILGHVPFNQQKITRSHKGKSPIEEPCIIRPVPSHSKNSRLPIDILDSQANDSPVNMPKLYPPYPIDSQLPCQKTPKIPYPCDNNLLYPVINSCPYPVESKFDSSSYSEEDTKNTTNSSRANTVPYPIINNLSDQIPFPSDKICPYPKELQITHHIPSHIENENSMTYTSKESTVPYPTTNHTSFSNNSPYPTEPQITYPLVSYPKENSNTLPYSNGNICPYPILESVKKMEHRTSTLSTAVSEREQLSHPAIGFSNLTSRNYANASPSTIGSTVPYPTDIPNLMPMPLPMGNSRPIQKSIGFEQLVSSRISVKGEFEPSAPIESSIDSTEQQEETVVEAAVSTLPNIFQDLDFIDDVPSDDILTDDIPTDDIPTDDIPTDDIPTDDIPSYASSTYDETLSAIKKEKKKKSKRKVLVPA